MIQLFNKLFGGTRENMQLKIIAVISFIIMVVVNALANLLPINGQATGEISDKYANLFAPAGITFSIWSVIYIALFVYSLYQFKKVRAKKSQINENTYNSINRFFIASSLLNTIWIFAWHYEVLWATVILMIGILYCLIKINTILRNQKKSFTDTICVATPFSIYFGWITVATIANITSWLVSVEWDGFGIRPGVWMVAILIIGALIATRVILQNRDAVYGLVIVWAYTGILVKHLSEQGWNGAYPSVLAALYILLPVLISVVIMIARDIYTTKD
jgi:hypothetical protein